MKNIMRSKLIPSIQFALIFFVSAWSVVLQAVDLNQDIPVYHKVEGVSGNLISIGSDTLANLMTFWTESFTKNYPNVNFEVMAAGSSTAPPALAQATSNLGPMSRRMKSKEITAFEKIFGYKPTAIAVAVDALAVYVNPSNPIKELSIAEVDAIFSANNKCGLKKKIVTWGDVGLTGSWGKKRIQLYGRNSVSGTYGYFKHKALCKGDYSAKVNEQPGSASVIQSIASSVNAIGYSGIGYKTSDVKFVSLSKKKGTKAYFPSTENAINGRYPLSRFLYIYINKKPGEPIDKLTMEFLKSVLSQSGQKIVLKSGFIPLSKKVIEQQLKLVESK